MGALAVKPHPLRVRPLGSSLLALGSECGAIDNLRDISLGTLRTLPDDLLLRIFSGAAAGTLALLATCSRAMRVLAYTEELWKACLLEELPSCTRLRWDVRGWRHSYLVWRLGALHAPAAAVTTALGKSGAREALETDAGSTAACYYYSDVLYAPWQCGTAAIPRSWSRVQDIPRVAAASLSVAEFAERFEAPHQPVIITGLVEQWPAASQWSFERLRERFGDAVEFHVSGYAMGLANFFDYCNTTTDEQPLYLFDREFGGKRAAPAPAPAPSTASPLLASSWASASEPPASSWASASEEASVVAAAAAAAASPSAAAVALADEYKVPPYYAPERDLFSSLPAEWRPHHRWLIIGGTRSGSKWHVDPNGTSAWNACLAGRKKWILTPPGHPPPGVSASPDGTSVTSPESLYEWFRVFYSLLTRERLDGRRVGRLDGPPLRRPREATLGPGELLFVPAGWWHCCLNLEPSIAVTQNYAPACAAAAILAYLRRGASCGDLISGVPALLRPHLHERFAEVLAARHPEALRAADQLGARGSGGWSAGSGSRAHDGAGGAGAEDGAALEVRSSSGASTRRAAAPVPPTAPEEFRFSFV